MLTYQKHQTGVFVSLRKIAQAVNHWWVSMTDQQQAAARRRGVAAVGCVLAATVALPAISVNYDTKLALAQERETAQRFAAAETVRDGIDPIGRSALIDHPWMVAVEYAVERDPRETLTRYGDRYRDSAALKGLASFDPRHIQTADKSAAELQCLSEAIYYEARSESALGQMAVAEVILNRVKDHRYPDSICEVVYQGSERTTGCQFSFTCDGSMKAKPRGRSWTQAKRIATHMMLGLNTPLTGEATHYHADYVNPVWNSSLIETRVVGTHIFYRFPRGTEWAMVREREAQRVEAVMAAVAKAEAPTVVPAEQAKPKSLTVITAAPAP